MPSKTRSVDARRLQIILSIPGLATRLGAVVATRLKTRTFQAKAFEVSRLRVSISVASKPSFGRQHEVCTPLSSERAS